MWFGKKSQEIKAPCCGKCIPLSQVDDPVFSGGMMGAGAAVIPADGMICAPCDGKLIVLTPTLHAFGIKAPDGAEVLVHIGIDTVDLKGEGFKSFRKINEEVKAGDKIIEADLGFIKSKGLSTAIPVVVTNSTEFKKVQPVTGREVSPSETIIEYSLK